VALNWLYFPSRFSPPRPLLQVGVAVLSANPEATAVTGGAIISLGYGDWLCIGGAFSFAIYLIAMEKYANAENIPSVPLQVNAPKTSNIF
jgi:drug/metabolite transporter (DMT)-like permease